MESLTADVDRLDILDARDSRIQNARNGSLTSVRRGELTMTVPPSAVLVLKDCKHTIQRNAVLDCDLSRGTDDHSRYSTQIEVGVCEDCGAIQLRAKAHRHLCDWLESGCALMGLDA